MNAKFMNRVTGLIVALVLGAVASGPSAAFAAEDAGDAGKSGASLYRENCARCHSERYPTERSDVHWKTIMMHMRVRAQLPGQDAKKILEYLTTSN